MSKVYFTRDPAQADKLFDIAGFDKVISSDESVVLKIHFGEKGNNAYLKPHLIKPIIEKVKAYGGKPFLTDSNVLYKGARTNTLDHLRTAQEHGYAKESMGAPIVIADEEGEIIVPVNLKHFQKVHLGKALQKVKKMLVITHFKGHELTGFGGAIKNVGMGLATRLGKLYQHSDCENCKAKEACKKFETISSCWIGTSNLVQEKMVEYFSGAVKDKKVGYFNFMVEVSPNCDCYEFNDPPIVPDLGILASFDPIAIDQASLDLVGKDKFRTLYPKVEETIQLVYGEEIGLGSRKYELVEI